MVDFGRDLDIGIPPADTFNVNVKNFVNVISAIDSTTREMWEAVSELKKIRRANELILGEEVEYVE